ncbi:hypothetical protein HPB47_006692 [Ixodes persulcatus]|uniref:Uncharacterized protein n=1 Tax=Ixodes persulcatus TaxID=34615 RepID=A0AC60P9M1_IXOPE|nr:hypothetical protein HPB47_006692 [Ixodes persulcatus]
MRKKPQQGYPELAYDLRANLIEWLKSADVYGQHDKVVECMALEQFYCCLPDAVRFWLQDKSDMNTVERAGELAEEYASRRKVGEEHHSRGKLERSLKGPTEPTNGMRQRPAKTTMGKVSTYYVREAFNHDKDNNTLKTMPGLTASHLDPNGFEKMRVSLAFQLFGDHVLRGLHHYKDIIESSYGNGALDGTELFFRQRDAEVDASPSTSNAVAFEEEMPSTSTSHTILAHLQPRFSSPEATCQQPTAVQAPLGSVSATEREMKLLAESEEQASVEKSEEFIVV